jgi:predicted RNA binding protein with dsRBD fold (UPF0201 family)
MNNYTEDHNKVSKAIEAIEDMTTMLEVFMENTDTNINFEPSVNKVGGKWRSELKIYK